MFVRDALAECKFDGKKTLHEYFAKLEDLFQQLRSTGVEPTNLEMVYHILSSLPKEYDATVSALKTLPESMLTVNVAKNRLLSEELKFKKQSVSVPAPNVPKSVEQTPNVFVANARKKNDKGPLSLRQDRPY